MNYKYFDKNGKLLKPGQTVKILQYDSTHGGSHTVTGKIRKVGRYGDIYLEDQKGVYYPGWEFDKALGGVRGYKKTSNPHDPWSSKDSIENSIEIVSESKAAKTLRVVSEALEELPAGKKLVKITSHRGREKLKRLAPDMVEYTDLWGKGTAATGYYIVPEDVDISGIKGASISNKPISKLMRTISSRS